MAYTPITENGNTYFRRLMFQAFSVQLMLTYYVEMPEMGISILSDRVGKPFSVRPAVDDDILCQNT